MADGLSGRHTVIIDLWFKVVLEPAKQRITFRPTDKINTDNLRKDLGYAYLL